MENPTDKQYKQFFAWQVVLGIVHWAAAFGLAGYADAENKDWTTQVSARYNAWASQNGSSCAEGDACIIYSVEEKIGGEVSLIWATASASIISGAHHLFAAWQSRWYRRECIESGFNPVRWLDYAGSSAIMFAIISILFTSPPDLFTLVLAFVLQFLVVVAGSGSEALWAAGKDAYARIVFLATLAAYVVPWTVLYVIFGLSIRADVSEDSCGVPFLGNAEKRNPPDFVWVAVIGLFLLFSSFAAAHAAKIYRADRTQTTNLEYEYIYSFLSFTSKIILLANIAGGILGRTENNVTERDKLNGIDDLDSVDLGSEPSDEFADVWIYVGIALGISFVMGVVLLGGAYRSGLLRWFQGGKKKRAKTYTRNQGRFDMTSFTHVGRLLF